METLAHLCEKLPTDIIDFLKVDVEGAEEVVLKGMDFEKFLPRLIIIEVVEIKSQQQAAKPWQPLLEKAGYLEAYFDGINSYFVQKNDDEARKALAIPLNAADNFIKYQHTKLSFVLKKKLKG